MPERGLLPSVGLAPFGTTTGDEEQSMRDQAVRDGFPYVFDVEFEWRNGTQDSFPSWLIAIGDEEIRRMDASRLTYQVLHSNEDFDMVHESLKAAKQIPEGGRNVESPWLDSA